MYEYLLEECNSILEEQGLPPVEAEITTTTDMLSYTECNGIIYLGKAVRGLAAIGLWDLTRTVMHECLHMLVDAYPPSSKQKKPFGTRKEWAEEQSLTSYGNLYSMGHVTRYGMTHPEEDFVETGTVILMEEDVPDTDEVAVKIKAVNGWFKSLSD